MGHSQPLFLYFCLFNTVDSKMFNINFCQWWDSNHGPLDLEATPSTNWATTTAPMNFLFLNHYSHKNMICTWTFEAIGWPTVFFLLKMGHPRPLFRLFSSFQTNNTILTSNKCENCPSSIQRRDLNSQPSDYKSPHLITRPGLPSWLTNCYLRWKLYAW